MDRTTTLGQGEPVQPSAPRPTAIGAAPMTLRARRPAYGVMQECLRLQAEAPGRSRAQRFWGVDPVAPAARSWFKGALGERRVAAELDRLGPAFTVLHAVPIGTGSTDIDHLVIGPTGVFSINTKNHSGQQVFVGGGSFMVGGGRTSHIGAAQSEGRKATRLLSTAAGGSFSVQPLLVVAADRITFGKSLLLSSCSGRTRCADGSSGFVRCTRTKPSGTCRWLPRSEPHGTRPPSCRTTLCGSSSGSIGWSATSRMRAYDGVGLRSRSPSGWSGFRSLVSSRSGHRACAARLVTNARRTEPQSLV